MNKMNRCSENNTLGTSSSNHHARGPTGSREREEAWCQSLPLGTKLTTHRNVPKIEEAINMAFSDCTVQGGNKVLLLTSVY
jgi:hypothetical protein